MRPGRSWANRSEVKFRLLRRAPGAHEYHADEEFVYGSSHHGNLRSLSIVLRINRISGTVSVRLRCYAGILDKMALIVES
jgi:hypothetical protein